MLHVPKLLNSMERRVRRKPHARCGAGEKVECGADAPRKPYLSLSGAKSQGMEYFIPNLLEGNSRKEKTPQADPDWKRTFDRREL